MPGTAGSELVHLNSSAVGVCGRVARSAPPGRGMCFRKGEHLVAAVGVQAPHRQAAAARRAEDVHQLIQRLVVAVALPDQGRRVGDEPAPGKK